MSEWDYICDHKASCPTMRSSSSLASCILSRSLLSTTKIRPWLRQIGEKGEQEHETDVRERERGKRDNEIEGGRRERQGKGEREIEKGEKKLVSSQTWSLNKISTISTNSWSTAKQLAITTDPKRRTSSVGLGSDNVNNTPACSQSSVSIAVWSCPDRQHPTRWNWCSCTPQFPH